MRSSIAILAILAVLPAGSALAAGTTTTATPPPAAAVAKTKPAAIKLKLVNPLRSRGDALALVRRAFLVRGYLPHYATGQTVSVHAYRNGKRFSAKRAKLRRGPHGSGRFFVFLKSYGEGSIGVTAVHHRTAKLRGAASGALHVNSYWPTSTARPVVALLQRKLAAERYAVGQTGYFDARTGRALLAFRKVNGLPRTYSSSTFIMHQLLAGKGGYKARFKTHGRHVEGDLTHQVIALVDPGGKVHAVYPVSSGKPSTPTVLGHFYVYRRDPGTNAEGMVHSSYFIRGYAVHGYASVPTYAASHGCLRVPVPDSLGIFDWIRFGTPVDVFYR